VSASRRCLQAHRGACELEGAGAPDADRRAAEDLLRFQVGELDAARLRAARGELRTGGRLQHAERFAPGWRKWARCCRTTPLGRGAAGRAGRVLTGPRPARPGFARRWRSGGRARAGRGNARPPSAGLRDTIVFEPGRLEAIDDRLDRAHAAKRKYGRQRGGDAPLPRRAAAELDRLQAHEELLGEERRALRGARSRGGVGRARSRGARRDAAARLAPAVQRELRQLGMERAPFEVAVIELALAEWGPRAASASSSGSPRTPASRANVARHRLRRRAGADDAGGPGRPLALRAYPDDGVRRGRRGIGGRAASVVGEKLAAVGAGRQVLCVTHLAPIAALADQHVRVAKSVRGGRTRASAGVVAGDERVAEIARMLGGDASGAAALEHGAGRSCVDGARSVPEAGRIMFLR